MNISRRGFISGLGLAGAAMATGAMGSILRGDGAWYTRGVSATGWAGLCDKILMRDEIPHGAYAIYENSPEFEAVYRQVFHRQVGDPVVSVNVESVCNQCEVCKVGEGGKFILPTGDIVAMDELSIKMIEDILLLNLLYSGPFKSIRECDRSDLANRLSMSFACIERSGIAVDKVCVNPAMIPVLSGCCECLDRDRFGLWLWCARVCASDLVPMNDVLIFGPPEFVGVNAIRYPMEKYPSGIVYQESGMVVVEQKESAMDAIRLV